MRFSRPFHRFRKARLGRTARESAVLVMACLAVLSLTPAASAQGGDPSVEVEQLACLPVSDNGVVRARVEDPIPDTEVRLYFRRLHHLVEDAYWIAMEPAGGGEYWATFPQPAAEELERFGLEARRIETDEQRDNPFAAWWLAKDTSTDRDPNEDLDDEVIRERASEGKLLERDWMRAMSLEEVQDWLEGQRYEPAEYLVTVVDPQGRTLARSPLRVVAVTDDCPVDLTLQEQGFANNLVIGETAFWQQGEEPFHWLCDGIVSRVGPEDVLRADGVCRACVVAAFPAPALLIPALAGGGVGIADIIEGDDEPPVSPSQP